MQQRAFNTTEAAKYLGISECFLKQSRMKNSSARKLDAPNPTYLGCRRVVYLIEDMNCWLDSKKTESNSLKTPSEAQEVTQ